MPLVIIGLVLAFLVMLLFGGTEIDRGLLLLFHQLDAPQLKGVAGAIPLLAHPIVLLVALAAGAGFLAYRREWRRLILLVPAVVVGHLLVLALEIWTVPMRPDLDERVLATQQLGFPDRPAATATITLVALAFLVTRHRPARTIALGLAAFLSLLVGFSRTVTGAVWPSDVIGGWALGLAWTLLLLRLAGEDLSEGTARQVRHSPAEGDDHGKPQDRDRARER